MTDAAATPSPAEDPLREQLLEAAARVFASKGYAGTKIMDIVKAAGLSSGAVYGRFESKDELLMEAVLGRVGRNQWANRFNDRQVAELLVAMSRSEGALDDIEAIQLEAYVAARREPKLAEAVADARATWRRRIQPIVDKAVADGTASPDADIESIVFFVETLRLGLLVQRGADIHPPDPAAWTQFMRSVIQGIAAPPPPQT